MLRVQKVNGGLGMGRDASESAAEITASSVPAVISYAAPAYCGADGGGVLDGEIVALGCAGGAP